MLIFRRHAQAVSDEDAMPETFFIFRRLCRVPMEIHDEIRNLAVSEVERNEAKRFQLSV